MLGGLTPGGDSRALQEILAAPLISPVADEGALNRCADSIETKLGPVEILVNSAGVIQVPMPPERLSMESWDEVVRVDQRGTYVAALVFGTRMPMRRPRPLSLP